MREFPSIENLYQRFKKKEFVVLAVNIGESVNKVKDYMAEHGLTFPALLDSDSSVTHLYRVRGTPTRFLIDREGKLVAGSIGPRDWATQEVRTLITTLLEPARKQL